MVVAIGFVSDARSKIVRLTRGPAIVEGEGAERFTPERAMAVSDFSDGCRENSVGNRAEEERAGGVHCAAGLDCAWNYSGVDSRIT